jgi:hypothetical protein
MLRSLLTLSLIVSAYASTEVVGFLKVTNATYLEDYAVGFAQEKFYYPFTKISAHCTYVWREVLGHMPDCHLPTSCPRLSYHADASSFLYITQDRVCMALNYNSEKSFTVFIGTATIDKFAGSSWTVTIRVLTPFLYDDLIVHGTASLMYAGRSARTPYTYDHQVYPPVVWHHRFQHPNLIHISAESPFPGILRTKEYFIEEFHVGLGMIRYDDHTYTIYRTSENFIIFGKLLSPMTLYPGGRIMLSRLPHQRIKLSVSFPDGRYVEILTVDAPHSRVLHCTLGPVYPVDPPTTEHISGVGFGPDGYFSFNASGNNFTTSPAPLVRSERVRATHDYLNLMYIFTHLIDFIVFLIKEILYFLMELLALIDPEEFINVILMISNWLLSVIETTYELLNGSYNVPNIMFITFITYYYFRDSYITTAITLAAIVSNIFNR